MPDTKTLKDAEAVKKSTIESLVMKHPKVQNARIQLFVKILTGSPDCLGDMLSSVWFHIN